MTVGREVRCRHLEEAFGMGVTRALSHSMSMCLLTHLHKGRAWERPHSFLPIPQPQALQDLQQAGSLLSSVSYLYI